jgi:HEAT repeat protein
MREFGFSLALTAVVACLGGERDAALTVPEEAIYDGKRLSRWLALSKDEDPKLRVKAAEALGKFGPAAVPTLTELLEDDDGWMVLAVARALWKINRGSKAVVPALTKLSKDKDWQVRWNAVTALGDIGAEAKASIPTLTELINDTHVYVRRAAAQSLDKINKEEEYAPPIR